MPHEPHGRAAWQRGATDLLETGGRVVGHVVRIGRVEVDGRLGVLAYAREESPSHPGALACGVNGEEPEVDVLVLGWP